MRSFTGVRSYVMPTRPRILTDSRTGGPIDAVSPKAKLSSVCCLKITLIRIREIDRKEICDRGGNNVRGFVIAVWIGSFCVCEFQLCGWMHFSIGNRFDCGSGINHSLKDHFVSLVPFRGSE